MCGTGKTVFFEPYFVNQQYDLTGFRSRSVSDMISAPQGRAIIQAEYVVLTRINA
jgi:hypothetical protein